MGKDILALDFNGVYANADEGKRRAVTERTKLIIPYGQVQRVRVVGPNIYFRHSDPERKGLFRVTSRQYDDSMEDLYATDKFFDLMEPMPDVETVLPPLAERFTLRLVSDAVSLTEERISEWFWRWKLKEPDQIRLTRRESKVPYYRDAKAAADNELKHLAAVAGSSVIPFLMLPPTSAVGGMLIDEPANLPSGIRVVRGWREFSHELTALTA